MQLVITVNAAVIIPVITVITPEILTVKMTLPRLGKVRVYWSTHRLDLEEQVEGNLNPDFVHRGNIGVEDGGVRLLGGQV